MKSPVLHIELSNDEIRDAISDYVKANYKIPYQTYKFNGSIGINCSGHIEASVNIEEV